MKNGQHLKVCFEIAQDRLGARDMPSQSAERGG
jgi:hypothetical protein